MFSLLGLELNVNGNTVRIKVFVTKIAADIPAKSALLNMIGYNGAHGCSLCEMSGVVVKQGSGHARSYAFSSGQTWNRRSNRSMLECWLMGTSTQAVRLRRAARKRARFHVFYHPSKFQCMGLKGRPHVSCLPSFNAAVRMVIDDMHAIYIGVVKKIVELWIRSNRSAKYYLTKKKVHLI